RRRKQPDFLHHRLDLSGHRPSSFVSWRAPAARVLHFSTAGTVRETPYDSLTPGRIGHATCAAPCAVVHRTRVIPGSAMRSDHPDPIESQPDSPQSPAVRSRLPIDESRPLPLLPRLIFASRWLQLPLYFGLIVAQLVYVFLFVEELVHLVELLWNPAALDATVERLAIAERNKETVIMIIVLSLIDVVMISNLLIMVIVGGYETFVSRLGLEGHPDQPEWLSHVNANVLKVKLATAIIGISSIHLLK